MNPTADDMKPQSPHPDAVKAKRQTWFFVGGAILLCLALFFGNFHIVQSEKGTTAVQKVHFTFSETFVSLDAITGQPLITAKAQNPLAVKALQRDGLLETDEQMQERVQKEVQEQFEENQRDFQQQQAAAAMRVREDLQVGSVSSTADSFSWSVTGVVTNTGTTPYQLITIEFDLLSEDGETVVGTATDINPGTLAPGQKWRFRAMVVNDQARRYRLSDVSGQPVSY